MAPRSFWAVSGRTDGGARGGARPAAGRHGPPGARPQAAAAAAAATAAAGAERRRWRPSGESRAGPGRRWVGEAVGLLGLTASSCFRAGPVATPRS